MMEALPASWDGNLIMVDHMAGFVSTYLIRQSMAVVLKLSCVKVPTYIVYRFWGVAVYSNSKLSYLRQAKTRGWTCKHMVDSTTLTTNWRPIVVSTVTSNFLKTNPPTPSECSTIICMVCTCIHTQDAVVRMPFVKDTLC